MNSSDQRHLDSLLLEAVKRGCDADVEALLAANADIDARHDENGLTPLQAAASNGHTSTCSTLVSLNAYVNASDRFARTPLHEAAKEGHTATCSMLVSLNALTSTHATTLDESRFIKLPWRVMRRHARC